MKRFWPLFLLAVGLLLLVGGLIYDLMFAGIPYQEPTPEMSARYAYHVRVASLICRVGSGVFLFGSLAGMIRLVTRGFRRRVVS